MRTRNPVNNSKLGVNHGKVQKYLISSQIVSEKKVKFYVNWVNKFYFPCKKDPGAAVAQNEIEG
jgi:hypothetical protein